MLLHLTAQYTGHLHKMEMPLQGCGNPDAVQVPCCCATPSP